MPVEPMSRPMSRDATPGAAGGRAMALVLLDQAVAALTYDQVERLDARSLDVIASGDEIPLHERSIGQDLAQMERWLGIEARDRTLLSAIAASIRIALSAVDEARTLLRGDGTV